MGDSPAPEIALPFKPFTLDEVRQITGATARVIDIWVATRLGLKTGCGAYGLDYMQAFAVYCGWRFLCEGAPGDKAGNVVRFVAAFGLESMLSEFRRGYVFPVPEKMVMVPAPDGQIGSALRLDKLHGEFRAGLARVFPEDKS